MNDAIKTSFLILMGASLIALILEAIEKKQSKSFFYEKPHIRLFANGAIASSFIIIMLDLIGQKKLFFSPADFLGNISSLFLILNTLIAVFLGTKTLSKNQNGDIYFLILSSLAISIANVYTDFIALRLVCSCGWLLIMTTLAIKTTPGGKKAEIGLKLGFNALITLIFITISIYFLTSSSHSNSMVTTLLKIDQATTIQLAGILFFAISGLCLMGAPPFHFAAIDCADGGNTSIAFLLLSNSIIQGTSHILAASSILANSPAQNLQNKNIIGVILAAGFLILWLRALDQRSIRRTASYVASSIGPLFCLSILFGKSTIFPDLYFYATLFCFLTLALITLYGSLSYMSSINLSTQTWEDMSGFGRANKLQTLYFLIGIASIAGLPGTLGYSIKLSLIRPMKDSLLFNSIIFISIAIGAACAMRIFVFAFSKHPHGGNKELSIHQPPFSLMIASAILIGLGFIPLVQ